MWILMLILLNGADAEIQHVPIKAITNYEVCVSERDALLEALSTELPSDDSNIALACRWEDAQA